MFIIYALLFLFTLYIASDWSNFTCLTIAAVCFGYLLFLSFH